MSGANRTVQREHACPRLCLPALLLHGHAPHAAVDSALAGKGCWGSKTHTDDFGGGSVDSEAEGRGLEPSSAAGEL